MKSYNYTYTCNAYKIITNNTIKKQPATISKNTFAKQYFGFWIGRRPALNQRAVSG